MNSVPETESILSPGKPGAFLCTVIIPKNLIEAPQVTESFNLIVCIPLGGWYNEQE